LQFGNTEQLLNRNLQKRSCFIAAVIVVPSLVELTNAAEARRGCAAVDAAATVGVKHIIYSSALAQTGAGVMGLGSKRAIEERLAEAGPAWTVLRPAFFMENFATFFTPKEEKDGLVLSAPIPMDRPTQMVSVADVAAAAAAVIATPKAFASKKLDIVGQEIALTAVATSLSQALGKTVTPKHLHPSALFEFWPQGVGLFQFLTDVGTNGDLATLSALIKQPTTFDAWAVSHFGLAG
jgi:uncharacterized protein YbjT (DUF2867 family)